VRFFRTITDFNRPEILKVVSAVPIGSEIEIVSDRRTLSQNKLMHVLLRRLSDQLEHCGEHWEPDDYKAAFLKAMGKKLRFMPALDGVGVVAVGYQSSKLSKSEMSEMIELIYSEGLARGVVFDAEAS
jgi:hypothetical protein